MTNSTPQFMRAALAALVCALGLFVTPAGFASETKKAFDIPAGEALPTLKQFAAQSGEQLLYSAEDVQGVTTHAVKGTLTAREALDRMVSGTKLTVVVDRKNGALSLVRDPDPNAARVAREKATTPKEQIKVEEGKVVLDTYQVTGSRLPLNSGESPVQPVLTYTARDIERTGATSLGQFWQYIPSVSSFATGTGSTEATGNANGGLATVSSNRTFAAIRGGSNNATLLLIDGKRAPRTSEQLGASQDLGGVPLSAIERIDVLLDGASAIYGSDAVNGVINIILKKRYVGTELRLSYDNTFDKDAGQWTASLSHGFARGKWTGLVSVSTTENNLMLQLDRSFLASGDRTLFGGASQGFLSSQRIGATGSVSVSSGTLPGVGTRYASIPTGSNGQNLTVAAFAAAGQPSFDASPGVQAALNYLRQRSGNARLAYEVNEYLKIEGTVRLTENLQWDNGMNRRAFNLTLPANYPGNPFVVPIVLNKIFYDLPPLFRQSLANSRDFGVSVSGRLFSDWRYDASVTYARTIDKDIFPKVAGGYGASGINATLVNAALAAGRAPNLIYDSAHQAPNTATNLDEFFVTTTATGQSDDAQIWTYSAQASGSVFDWQAGTVRASFGAEARQEYLDVADPNLVISFTFPTPPTIRFNSAFVEVASPLVKPEWRWPLLRQLDANVAVRHDSSSRASGAYTPRYGIAWRPVSPVLFRVSMGKGFLLPTLFFSDRAAVSFPSIMTAFRIPIDPLRGNENMLGRPITFTTGGNPDLRPQRSENWNFGTVVDVPKLKGLSLSFDYFDYKYRDQIAPGLGTIPDLLTYAPELLIRGPNLPGDQPGWPGPITGLKFVPVNVSVARTAGYNFGANWKTSTPFGELSFKASGERILVSEQRLTPVSAPLVATHKKFNPLRIVSSVFWSRKAWEAGVTNIHSTGTWVDSQNTALVPSGYSPDSDRWDVNASYDFAKGHVLNRGAAWWCRLLGKTKVNVTIINVLNTEPPFDVNGFLVTNVIDPRLRRYVIDVTTRF